MKYRQSNYQDILKSIAMIAMIIDHVGIYLIPEEKLYRCIGRYAFPIFCFFAGYNFKSKINYTMLVYGAVLHLFVTMVIFQKFVAANILISIFCGHVYLAIFRKYFDNIDSMWNSMTHILILMSLMPFTISLTEYGTLATAIMLLGHLAAKTDKKMLYVLAFITCLATYLHVIMIFSSNFSMHEMFYSLCIMLLVFLSLIYQNFNKTNQLGLVMMRKNMLNIYCLHLIIILLTRKYS